MRFLLLPPMLMVSLSVPALSQAAKIKTQPINWDGEWRLLVAESDKVDALIEEHLQNQNFAAKLIWKHKLQSACQVYGNLDILLGERFSVTFGKELPADTPADGAKGEWKRSDGEKFRVSMNQEDSHITQTFQGDGYTLTYAYALSKDAQSLALQITYSNPKRNTPFSYKLAYKKSN